MHIPVNRWTVGLAALLAMVFGSDIVEPIYRIIGILALPHVPAV